MQGAARREDLLAQNGRNRSTSEDGEEEGGMGTVFRPGLAAGKREARIGRRLHN